MNSIVLWSLKQALSTITWRSRSRDTRSTRLLRLYHTAKCEEAPCRAFGGMTPKQPYKARASPDYLTLPYELT